MAQDDFIKQVKGESPFPWKQVAFPNGQVQVLDANSKEVPLFTITNFVCFITSVMNQTKEEKAAA